MWDKNLVREILEQVLWSVRTVSRRFAFIQSPSDFVISDEGLEKLDAICMQLLAIGESIKQVDRVTGGGLFSLYHGIDWRSIMRMRDVISQITEGSVFDLETGFLRRNPVPSFV